MKNKVCIVVARYYKDVAADLLKGTTLILDDYKIKHKILYAPGVFELPFLISANIKKYNAFVALGCVIKGETSHFDLISKAAIDGIMKLSIEHKKPIGNGIITCLNRKQALARRNKGREAAVAVLSVLDPNE